MAHSYVFLAILLIATSYSDDVEGTLSAGNNNSTCPPWMLSQSGECLCRVFFNNPSRIALIQSVFCDAKTLQTYAALGTCITYDSPMEDEVVIGKCPYAPVKEQTFYYGFFRTLPENESDLNDVMCGPFNRQGLLCSSCKPGYGVSVYTFGHPCAKCNNNNNVNGLWYLLLELVPITILYIIVILFRVRATAAPLAGLVFFSHAIINTLRGRISIYIGLMYSTNRFIRVASQIGLFFCGIWSLDFFHFSVTPFCVSENIKNLQAVLLEYCSALYPFALVLVTFLVIELHGHNVRLVVLLWKPFNRLFARFRRTWDIRYSIVNAFSTFLLLSYSKIISVSFRLLYHTSIYNVNGTIISQSSQLDPTTQNNSGISFVAITVIIIFTIFPILLLLLYPTKLFQKCLRRCRCRAVHAVHLFVNTYQGCLNDGSNNTRDYRAVSALYLLLRFVLLSIYIQNTVIADREFSFILFSILFMVISISLATFKPYKEDYLNYCELAIFFLLGIEGLFSYTWLIFPQDGYAIVLVLICLLPHCVLICYIAYVLFRGKVIFRWIKGHLSHCAFEGRGFIRNTVLRLFSGFRSSKQIVIEDNELPDRFLHPENYSHCLSTDYNNMSDCNGDIAVSPV